MQSQERHCHWKIYQLSCVHSKAVVLLLIWNFFRIFGYIFVYIMYSKLAETGRSTVIANVINLSFLFYPVLCWVGDTWLGRYKVITVSLYIATLGPILMAIAYSINSVMPNSSAALLGSTVLENVGWVISAFANAAIIATMLPYIIDQLVGAPAEQLSAAVFWWYWTIMFSYETTNLLYDIYQGRIFWIITALLSVTIPVVTHLVLKKWLIRISSLANPIKHIVKVLNYARKNKYPRRRSALTYWEDDYPSRVDLGKNKYGGPFTEEEVEDVKTVLRLLPLYIPLTVHGLFQPTQKLAAHYKPISVDILNLAQTWSSFLVLTLITAWQLLVYPFITNYIPSMLKRIGAGLFLLILPPCAYSILELIGHSMDNSVGCYLGSNKSSNTTNILPISNVWLIFPHMLHTFAMFILSVNCLEFLVAQSPKQMRAFMIALWYAIHLGTVWIAQYLQSLFSHLPYFSYPSCGFYYYLANMVVFIAVFLFYLFLSKRYQLRERNIPVNYHLFAENYYEKYISIATELEKQELAGHAERSCNY